VWCDGTVPTVWCDGTVPTVWCFPLYYQIM
jgi:hypothetical protein